MVEMKPRKALAAILAALVAVLVVVPACVSLASGDGQVCVASNTCPLSAVNPCMRKPSFAIVGRCAVAIE
jgi:hypothetical protein